jgi:hypothetical protein
MTDHDTFRWGDTATAHLLALNQAAGENGVAPIPSQLLNAKWERPCVWRLMLSIAYQVVDLDVGLQFTVGLFVQVGVGQASQVLPLASIDITATNPPTIIPALFFDVPAETMQVQFFVGPFSNGPRAQDSITVTAMCAPHAEPGAIAQMRRAAGAEPVVVSPDSEGLDRWMGPGFEDGQLRYRR